MKFYLILSFVFLFQMDSFAQIKFTSKRTGLGTITDITHAGDGSNRIFVANKAGTVVILDGTSYATLGTLLNISTLIATESEKGLLGLVFHPDFETNGYFFVNYNPAGTKNTVIARFTAATPSANSTVNNNTQKTIITITGARFDNHKAGDLAFGPDGYLYIPTGDGGDGGDPDGNGQNGNTLLGKILRIDINTTSPYLIPSTNPFVSNANVLDEIWDIGLRNPWRISFDRQTNDLWIADVGQGAREEIDFEASGTTGGYNYGWDCREGKIAYGGCSTSPLNFREPIFDYTHCSGSCGTSPVGVGNSITGGFVYRGTIPANASMVGYYIFADYVSKHAWMLKYNSSSIVDTQLIGGFTPSGITSFGELENAELMAGTGNGDLGLIEATGSPACTQAPSISLSSSASSYIRGSSFTVNAAASDPDGTVSKVEFYNNNVLLGMDASAPYSYTISPANNASYSITGKVFDNCSLSTTSSPALTITTTVSCSDGFQNGTETGVDCGGNCTACIAACSTNVNLSQGKTSSQSSNFDGSNSYPASRSNNGNLTDFHHTGLELQPWWQVDLGADFQVSTIEITNRTDCCGNRLKRFRVFVSSTPINSYATAGNVYQYDNAAGLTNAQFISIPNINKVGRYVKVWADFTGYGNNYLHLAEVKVLGCCSSNQNPSVSISSPSSTYPRGSSFTINANASDPGGSVSSVEFYNDNNLLGIDNTAPFSFDVSPASLTSYNLTAKAIDNCNGSTISSPALVISTTVSCSDGFQNGTETGVDCGGSCTACTASCPSPTNISQNKTATQSGNFDGANTYPASLAVDGSVSSSSFNHTSLQTQPWLQIDLGSMHRVTSIELTHRTGCPTCAGRTKRFRVFITSSPASSFASSGFVFEYNSAGGLGNGEVLNIPNLNVLGQYVRIWADNGSTTNYLHLAEVKVMGCSAGANPCLNNQTPTVSLSSTSSSFPRGSSFTITANPNDPENGINGVEFYDGANLLGTDNTQPYNFIINPATATSYNFTAKVIDNCLATATSTPLAITTTVSCSDGYKNGSETGIDCGGSCAACISACSTSVNLSQNKTATQSGNFDGPNTYPASLAVDGSVSSSSFNHTSAQLQPWLQINLGNSYNVTSIEITHRTGCPSCAGRTKKFRVFITPSPVASYSTAGFVYEYNSPTGLGNGEVLNIPNIIASGQYVRVWADNGSTANFLHLAEVKVLGCLASGTLTSEEPTMISAFKPNSSLGIQLFPNPATDIIHFRFEIQPEGDVNAQIFDLQGRVMLSQKLKNNEIDIARLESGSYIVRIQSKEGLSVHKIVKM